MKFKLELSRRLMFLFACGAVLASGLYSPASAAIQDLVGKRANNNNEATVLPVSESKLVASVNLTGRWRANDGGIYYVKQYGNEVWWYGQSGDRGVSWTNVFHGYINGNRIEGSWTDVPKGRIRQHGQMTLRIISNRKLKAVWKTGGFGGSFWNR